MTDHVDRVLAQWNRQRPDLDVSPMAVLGRMSRLSRLVSEELRHTFAAHGLDSASFDMLATLRRANDAHRLTPGELTRESMVTSGAISQRLDRLEERGLVTRTPSTADARRVDVALTEDGLALIDRVLPEHVANGHRLLAPLDEARRAEVADALRVLLEALGDGVADGSDVGGSA
ncbi:MarR family winged helix-turn-helix transcriptional regulator [Yinghuangia seranimata]|uniref:MarR family winged helix-turn-helix transcriptional regulator n=1 Tax=Yinghuangia seranimata TaxID=408067 RepID=UPI00248C9FD6|nr:MarR family transcriptional regulator [Yinghuangia seranimata]MDI2131094.1 MarR family transcriptional regulator [Yinghuangia seranimata]